MATIKNYCGPKVQIQPHELSQYETGLWSGEEKRDGHWCEVTTDSDGKIVSLIGRSGKTFTNENVRSLKGLMTGIPSSVFIAELEAGTEAANKVFDKVGIRRLHVFDVTCLFGHDTRHLTYLKRRELLEIAFKNEHPQLKLIKRVTGNFNKFFDEISTNDGEGLVLKRNDSKYTVGKTNNWIRCKRFRYVDYYVIEVGKSDGGSDNFQVGLLINGKMTRVATIKNLPKEMKDPHAYVGKVIECVGVEVHDSGALRHGHFKRLRSDKTIDECTLEAALEA